MRVGAVAGGMPSSMGERGGWCRVALASTLTSCIHTHSLGLGGFKHLPTECAHACCTRTLARACPLPHTGASTHPAPPNPTASNTATATASGTATTTTRRNHTHAGKWTVQQAAELSTAAPTITASLDGRYMSAIRPERIAASKVGRCVCACKRAAGRMGAARSCLDKGSHPQLSGQRQLLKHH